MMKTKNLASALAALAALACASGARATIVTVTLTGASENINDATGVFGPVGERIKDEAFTETFLINTTVGTFAPPTPTSASYNSVFGAPGPYAVSASITINGFTFSTQGDNYSSAFITPGSSFAPTVYQLNSDGDLAGFPESQVNQFVSLELDGANLSTTLTQALQLTGTGDSSTLPFVLQTNSGPVTVYDGFIDGLIDSDGDSIINAQGTLYPTSITISAAPEPSVWALMLAGIGGVGLMLRSKTAMGFRFKDDFAA